jgi:hypothetical protein
MESTSFNSIRKNKVGNSNMSNSLLSRWHSYTVSLKLVGISVSYLIVGIVVVVILVGSWEGNNINQIGLLLEGWLAKLRTNSLYIIQYSLLDLLVVTVVKSWEANSNCLSSSTVRAYLRITMLSRFPGRHLIQKNIDLE